MTTSFILYRRFTSKCKLQVKMPRFVRSHTIPTTCQLSYSDNSSKQSLKIESFRNTITCCFYFFPSSVVQNRYLYNIRPSITPRKRSYFSFGWLKHLLERNPRTNISWVEKKVRNFHTCSDGRVFNFFNWTDSQKRGWTRVSTRRWTIWRNSQQESDHHLFSQLAKLRARQYRIHYELPR